jgi:hypothetical protein
MNNLISKKIREYIKMELYEKVKCCECGKKGQILPSPYDPCEIVKFEDSEIGNFIGKGHNEVICNQCYYSKLIRKLINIIE